jgi:hypothetical protein
MISAFCRISTEPTGIKMNKLLAYVMLLSCFYVCSQLSAGDNNASPNLARETTQPSTTPIVLPAASPEQLLSTIADAFRKHDRDA